MKNFDKIMWLVFGGIVIYLGNTMHIPWGRAFHLLWQLAQQAGQAALAALH